MMNKKYGDVIIQSNSISIQDIKKALLEDNNKSEFKFICNDIRRDFTDVELITFTLMAIPAMESLANIITLIKDEIRFKISDYMLKANITKDVKININIKLPFFNYEKNEEIFIEFSKED